MQMLYKLYRVSVLLCVFAIMACGQKGSGEVDDGLQIHLSQPQSEANEVFWLGVQVKKLRWHSGGATGDIDWTSGQQNLSLKSGDHLEFLGYDENGRLAVWGSSAVTETKSIFIPVRRVL